VSWKRSCDRLRVIYTPEVRKLSTVNRDVDLSTVGATTHDLYLAEFGGTTANLKVRGNVAGGNHTLEITALYDKNAASTGYYFYFDYLWPMVPQDVPDAPEVYRNVDAGPCSPRSSPIPDTRRSR
jgi:hypothetical protein